MQARSTGSFGVRLLTDQFWPPSYVKAMYRYQSPWKDVSSGLPPVVLPRNAYAARPESPAITSGKVTFWMPNGAPTSTGVDQVAPLSGEVAIIALPPICGVVMSPPAKTPSS